jgi:hypothetical protein
VTTRDKVHLSNSGTIGLRYTECGIAVDSWTGRSVGRVRRGEVTYNKSGQGMDVLTTCNVHRATCERCLKRAKAREKRR